MAPADGDFLSEGSADCDGIAEPVSLRAVVGQELGDLTARGCVKEVGRAGNDAVVVVVIGPNDGDGLSGGAADCDGTAEPVELCAVVGQELGDLDWVIRVAYVKEIRGAGVGAVVVVSPGPDDRGCAADRNRDAKHIMRRAVLGTELRGLYGIRGVRDVEEVGRAEPCTVVSGSPNDDDGAADRNKAEVVVRRAIVGQELGELGTGYGVKEVGRAGVGAVVIVTYGSDDGGGAADCDGVAERLTCRAIFGQELEELGTGDGVEEVG